MIPKYKAPYRTSRRYFNKKLAKWIKKRICEKFGTMKALAEQIGVNPATLRGVAGGTVYSKRMARMIEEAMGERLFPYTEDRKL